MKISKNYIFISLLVFINIFLILLDLSIGELKTSFFYIIEALLFNTNNNLRNIILDIRLPETLAASLTGAILAISGALE